MADILIVDDDNAFRYVFSKTIHSLGYSALETADPNEVMELAKDVDLIFLDLKLKEHDGLLLLEKLCSSCQHPPVVILTAFSSSFNTIEAMKRGAFDHLSKPIKRQEIKEVIERALKRSSFSSFSIKQFDEPEELIGESRPMRRVQKTIGFAAASDCPVLIVGETGTGKELVAKAIHRHSSRGMGPFIAVNCAAIPEMLFESEFFGHLKGSFTGALRDRKGKFLEASGGTLFLDEIAEMPLAMQAKLLRVLSEKTITPIGSETTYSVDVRIVAATNKNLLDLVSKGKFREDLLYRIQVLQIELPALRERGSDVLLLANHFLKKHVPGSFKKLSAAAEKVVLEYSWPGNVRQLENVIRRAGIIARGQSIEIEDLGIPIEKETFDVKEKEDFLQLDFFSAIAKLEKLLIEKALEESRGNRTEAARRLKIHRSLLYLKMKEHKIETLE
ncbi:sigma-54-dependent Fis family transcriptional regulator [Candidatus Methylacidiphilum fumarolicum]|uniref:DNA-binding response regulator, NtrC family (Contains REC, AAA-type ATPase, and DNA-binding Fis domains) n=2 Tax=Candidatus Methylacidiphilum fumarolicum TaxID=591154 RepID=I0JWA2_METFB|nr:sigma-54 dependent transcriptional regulator [Candidatus Methylacidiphilum fumarolicum]MBW6415831.1 sigma-54 dependent transcriptional regulator [Candidatus Methylacidiphilum fumarolicum]TFE67606.1 sigma-54-dependent Fis family transcriptional regulator [Candidatus Methylacidiphilum fumarolicum]TFE72300.1 sigma-54-dependent Fis family transcriptional regulator [Candidatus Methylacidiphilum fumarolicum]TFE75470.1 sigma-54-dependent Fis family transcriptional regulator [Candidatus Methylacidip